MTIPVHADFIPVSIALIGAGPRGESHGRALSGVEHGTLSAVIDTDYQRAKALGEALGVAIAHDINELCSEVQAVIVAVPTAQHYEVTKRCLQSGLHCLVEKPLCEEVWQADELIALAEEKKLILQVGHIERFNPAFIASRPYMTNPRYIEIHRLGPFDQRVAEVGVVLDLMIHDLDLVASIVAAPLRSFSVFGAKVVSEHDDLVKCRLEYEDGCVVDLSASRVSQQRSRTMRLFQADTYLSLDLDEMCARIHRKLPASIDHPPKIEQLSLPCSPANSFSLALADFVACIGEGRRPLVGGQEGREALALAKQIVATLLQQQ